MKVVIGKYESWADLRSIWGRRFDDWIEAKLGEERYDKLNDIIQPVFNIWNRRPWNVRKVKVRIDNHDVWNMDGTLALIIVPMLKKLKEQKHGAPGVEDEDVPENLRSTAAKPLTEEELSLGHADELFFDRWNWVLDEMIWAFEQSVDGYNASIGDEFDREVYGKFMDRVKNGHRLFGKYYMALWD